MIADAARPSLILAAGAWGLSPEEILIASRGRRSVADARALAMWLVRRKFGFSYPELGRIFGRDHTTCLHAVRRIDSAIRTGQPEQLANIARKVSP